MARAKRTERADARRRYRQTVTADPEAAGLDDTEPTPTAAAARTTSPGRKAAASSARPQMGFTDAMRAAWHRPDIRADIAVLPSLLLTRWFLIPLGLVLVGIVGVIAFPTNYVSGLLFQLMVLPPAMAPVFIVGFFAKRASYLLGFLISLVDVIGYAVFVYAVVPVLAPTAKPVQSAQELVLSALAIGPLSGIFFAAGAAWYRRFLTLSSRQRISQQRSGQQRPKASRPARG
ncbi:MAG: hypothetical protein HY264_10015 [Chloroflexi bacterium]|nr:hypothetical protein [Chloroflexota bacterium]